MTNPGASQFKSIHLGIAPPVKPVIVCPVPVIKVLPSIEILLRNPIPVPAENNTLPFRSLIDNPLESILAAVTEFALR